MKESIIERIRETKPGETICLDHEECKEVIRMISGGWHDAEKDPPKEDGTYIILDKYGTIQMLDYDTCSDNGEKWGYWQECFEQFGKIGEAFVPYEVEVIYWMQRPDRQEEGES